MRRDRATTGWFAAFGALTARQTGVPYGEDGSRFWGATFDPVGLYRLRAVFDWMASIGLTIEAIHGHALALQGLFLEGMSQHPSLSDARLVTPVGTSERGHFLTFRDGRGRRSLRTTGSRAHHDGCARQPYPFRLRLLPDRRRSQGGDEPDGGAMTGTRRPGREPLYLEGKLP